MEATSLWIYLYVITRSSFKVESSALVIVCVFFLQVLTLYCWKPDSNKELYNFKVNKWQYIHLVGLV